MGVSFCPLALVCTYQSTSYCSIRAFLIMGYKNKFDPRKLKKTILMVRVYQKGGGGSNDVPFFKRESDLKNLTPFSKRYIRGVSTV